VMHMPTSATGSCCALTECRCGCVLLFLLQRRSPVPVLQSSLTSIDCRWRRAVLSSPVSLSVHLHKDSTFNYMRHIYM
jgi:hypothetical protein